MYNSASHHRYRHHLHLHRSQRLQRFDMTVVKPLKMTRAKTFTGLTQKERARQLNSLDGSAAFTAVAGFGNRHTCARCAERRQRLEQLEREFGELRANLISKERVLATEDEQAAGRASAKELALVQESAKLRITIDTLMRFQVCSEYLRPHFCLGQARELMSALTLLFVPLSVSLVV